MSPEAPPVTVLTVCTGNVCRSPAAELLLRAGLGAGETGIRVASAGLEARAGEPVAAPVGRLLAARGVTADGFAARQLTPGLVRDADLVLTMTVAQRAEVVTRVPVAVRRVFTLREFAALGELVPPVPGDDPRTRLAALVAAVPRARARRRPGVDDDIEDPYRRPDEVHARSLGLVADAVDRLLALVSDAGAYPE